MSITANRIYGAVGSYPRKTCTQIPLAILSHYPRKTCTQMPLALIGYVAPVLPELAGVPVVSETESVVEASCSFSDMGIGSIRRCGFLVRNEPMLYVDNGFEDGTLEGFSVTSTNTALALDQVVALDFLTTSGAASKYAARLCSSGTSQASTLSCTIVGPTTFQFRWKVSSQANCDKLGWYLNDILQREISGEVAWREESILLPAGMHAIDFTYRKDGWGNQGNDCGWIDDVTLGRNTGIFYEAVQVPSAAGEVFRAALTDLPSGVVYIAAFVENAAGRRMSEFVSYRNTAGWQGGAIFDLSPDTFSHFIAGGEAILRSKTNCVYIGDQVL